MTRSVLRISVIALTALCCAGVTSGERAVPGASVGFANLQTLVAAHPLHAVLESYDREIAALRATQRIAGLSGIPTRTQASSAAARAEAARGAAVAQRFAGKGSAVDSRQESAAANALAPERASSQLGGYDEELRREASASLASFQRSTAQRIERAYEARRQQLYENESSLAYHLAQRDAGTRLALRLKLTDLHLTPGKRAGLQRELTVLDANEAAAVDALRRSDAATLTGYASELQRTGASANAAMAHRLQVDTAANAATRRRVAEAEGSVDAPAHLAAQVAFFRSTYRSQTDATAVAQSFRSTAADLTQRFGALGDADERSCSAAAAQIAVLENDRRELYGAIVAQIEGAARRVAKQRKLSEVVVAGARPAGAVDLTTPVRLLISASER